MPAYLFYSSRNTAVPRVAMNKLAFILLGISYTVMK